MTVTVSNAAPGWTSNLAPSSTPRSQKNEELNYHAGRTWQQSKNYVEDFTPTTNGLGTPKKVCA